MSFAFREVTISGLRTDVEGTSSALNEITDVMVNEMGWVIEDDRRLQSGSTNVTLTHKVVFNSDQGESGSESNWYLTITSGTSAAIGTNSLGLQIHSAYDVVTHDTAASGVETPAAHTTFTLGTDSDGIFNLWVSGDKDGIVLVTNETNTYDHMIIGKSKTFLDASTEPFGLYIAGAAGTTPGSTTVRSIVGNPPIALQNTNDGEFLTITLGINNEPRFNLGQVEPIFTVLPMVHTIDDAASKGAIGLVRNAWMAAPEDVGWLQESILTITGSNQTYLAFPDNSEGLVIRRT